MDSQSTVWALHGRLVADGVPCRVDIETLPFVIGRRDDVHMTVRSGAVSGRHALVDERDEQLWITDLDSKNGTFVNGVRIQTEVTLSEGDLVQIADTPFRLARERKSQNSTLAAEHDQGALAMVQLNALLNNQEIEPVYQPIIDLATGEVVAFEALARSRLIGLETPAAIFGAASHLGIEADISHLMRIKAISECGVSSQLPHLFVNTHPAELGSADLRDRIIEMRSLSPFQQLTLEIHEASLTNVETLMELRALLSDHDVKLAFDDFGVGQARIAELAAVSPEYVKFDRTLISGLDKAPADRIRVMRCLVGALNEIQVVPLAEGVETKAEAELCAELGFKLGQGFFYCRPAPMERINAEIESGNLRHRRHNDSTDQSLSTDTLGKVGDSLEIGHQAILDALKSPLERLSASGSVPAEMTSAR